MSKTDKVIINSADEVAKSVEILKEEFEKNSSEIKSLLEENNRLLGELIKKLDK